MLKCEAKITSILSKKIKCEMLGIHIALQLMLHFHNFDLQLLTVAAYSMFLFLLNLAKCNLIIIEESNDKVN